MTLLEVLLLVGAYIVQYFTRKKMGMARYVVYKNRSFEEAYPLQILKNISVVVLAVLTMLLLAAVIKKWNRMTKHQIVMSVVMTVLTIVSIVFTMKNSTEVLRAYYFISPMIAAAALMQILKTGIGIFTGGKKHEK